jgi:hypothetical protein
LKIMTDVRVKTENENQYRVDIPVKLEREELFQSFKKQERTRLMMEKLMDELLALALPVARPKALYRVSCIGARGHDWVEIDGVRFTSRVLSKNLGNIDTVFPYIVTCGKELDELPISPKDQLRYYCLDIIKMNVLFQAMKYFVDYLKEKYALKEATHLHPGEFADWPIEQQQQLFSLFSDTEKAIGVNLTSTKTIQPIKSGSGILFSNGASFESCQLCLQAKCPGRRAAYSPKLVKQFLG